MTIGRWMLALMALTWAQPLLAAQPANQTIRAVFIGIDRYAYSRPKVATAGFKDLRGAVNDAITIKAALGRAYGIAFDKAIASDCEVANDRSITLLNQCATRAGIFSAWRKQIAASAKGDTLILYFAGHGAQVINNPGFQQASGRNSTIMPHDARPPPPANGDDAPLTEILDIEIKAVIDEATAKGVNVVSIFDSCNSATATRDGPAEGEARSAPPLTVKTRFAALPAYSAPGPDEGYRVHLAASADGEEAREVGAVGVRSGVFTTALVETLNVQAMASASFADIATEVRLRVEATGHLAQKPHAEGALTARMGVNEIGKVLLEAYTKDGQIWLAGGQLTGVTAGSQYSLFQSNDDAQANAGTELAKANVVSVEASRALLRIDQQLGATLPPDSRKPMFALETAHAFGEEILRVHNGASGADKATLARLLAQMPFVSVSQRAKVQIILSGSEYKLAGMDGFAIASLGPISAPTFADRLRGGLQKIARVQMLLALRTDPAKTDLNFCITPDLAFRPHACQQARDQSSELAIPVDQEVMLVAVNRAEEPRYIYTYLIDESYAVTLVLPPGGGIDEAVAPTRPVADFGKSAAKQRLTFLTLSTDQPIKASVLEQSGAGARDPGACTSALARALCAAREGTRNPDVPRVGNWTATVKTVVVK